MGESMISRVRAPYALAWAVAFSLSLSAQPISAAELPQIKLSEKNTVPACVTPGRLMAFTEGRNAKLDARFDTIAADYMRIGEDLKIRWDIAFFQMLLETGNLSFSGVVNASQNNFAGLGATGRKERGESFADVPTGVKAHLEHVLLYAGERIENPVAERTRKIQEWNVLTSWQKTLSGPMTFAQLAKKWAPSSRNYTRDVSNIADAFYGGICNSPDPKPELLALAKPSDSSASAKPATYAVASADTAAASTATAKVSGADLARRAVEEARTSGSFVRSNLGAGTLIPANDAKKPSVGEPAAAAAAVAPPAMKIINASQEPESATVPQSSEDETPKTVKTAALGAGTKSAVTPAAPAKAGCKVWTASYGGARAVIIKARAGQQDNYTVLDVNEGAEKREAAAYIAAYAKGGQTVGEFSNPAQALDKAFELCPEG